ncbi:hypothetical protein BT69DRAFT_1278597 [Atractiella rhizophila]|nr:hypothetical protein BT69DRAFT_1278597 [Atractiella rhizophila]
MGSPHLFFGAPKHPRLGSSSRPKLFPPKHTAYSVSYTTEPNVIYHPLPNPNHISSPLSKK